MDIADLLTRDRVVDRLRGGSKKQVLQELSRCAAALAGLDGRTVFDVLLERERLGTTGVGDGVAIPHGKTAAVGGICGLFARLERPVDFDAVDDRPVDLVFLLLAPEGFGADHLKALARVSRLLRDAEVRAALRRAPNAAALFDILTADGRRSAA